ncbi:MAG: DUF6338 family protein [Bacteroidales bacterium]|jgi:hypothetical protein
MEDIWTIDKLKLFLLFFIPGFIAMKIYQLIISSEKTNFSEAIFEAIGFSCINFVLFSWVLIPIHRNNFYEEYTLWYYILMFLILFVTPVLLSILFICLTKLKFFKKHTINLVKSSWDFLFQQKEDYWVVVHLKDGRKIGGRYGSKSFASSYPRKETIYIEELWKMENNKFLKRVDKTKGIIILGDEILCIEFFK